MQLRFVVFKLFHYQNIVGFWQKVECHKVIFWYYVLTLVEKINWIETPQMSHTNDPLLNAKKCWTRAGPNFLPLGWAKKQLCNQFLNTITRSKVAWLPTDILFLGPVLNYKLPWNWFKRVIINWVSSFVSKLKSPWWCLALQMRALISSSRIFKFSQFILTSEITGGIYFINIFLFYIMDTPVFYNGVWQKISHAFSGDTI